MNRRKKSEISVYSRIPYLLLLIIPFAYFSIFGDYLFYYQEKQGLFLLSRDYLTGYLKQPGSPLLWLANLLTAFYYFPVAGAIILSLVISLNVYVTRLIMLIVTRKSPGIVPPVIGIALFFFHTSHLFLLANSLGLLVNLTVFYLIIKRARIWTAIILFPALYYFAGAFAWIFLIMFSLHLAIASFTINWSKILVLWLTIIVFIYILEEYVLFRTVRDLLTYPLSQDLPSGSSKLFLAFSALLAFLPIISVFRKISILQFKTKGIPGMIVPAALVLVSLVLISVWRYDDKISKYYRVEKLFTQGKYAQVVDYNKKHASNNILTNYLNNIALCETGRLNDQLFSFRQDPSGQTLFLKWEMSGEILRRGGYFYYTIGMINEAQRWAYENMIMKGITPDDLGMLIRTELVAGNHEIAAKYITLLKKSVFRRKEARAYSSLLFSDQAVASHPLLGRKKSEMISYDFFSITDDPIVNVDRILSKDSLNKKAYEYRIAWLLLRKDYPGLVSELRRMGDYGFTRIPVHMAEAVEAYRVLNLGPFQGYGSMQPDQAVSERFTRFLQTFQQYGNNLRAAEPALREGFGNTFWYYAFYR